MARRGHRSYQSLLVLLVLLLLLAGRLLTDGGMLAVLLGARGAVWAEDDG